MTSDEIEKAKILYTELKNYSAIGRILGYCSETIRVNLNPEVKIKEQKRWADRGSKTYHTKYKTDELRVKEHLIKCSLYRATDKAKELTKKRYLKDKAAGKYKYVKCSDSQRAHVIRRRDRKQNLKENFTKDDIQYIRELFHYRCAICSSVKSLCLDHWYPLSRGYPMTRKNAVLLCFSCNASKSNKLPSQIYSQDIINNIEGILQIIPRER
jgi:5-methylcytosine-specific restriction endonuclease McrA